MPRPLLLHPASLRPETPARHVTSAHSTLTSRPPCTTQTHLPLLRALSMEGTMRHEVNADHVASDPTLTHQTKAATSQQHPPMQQEDTYTHVP